MINGLNSLYYTEKPYTYTYTNTYANMPSKFEPNASGDRVKEISQKDNDPEVQFKKRIGIMECETCRTRTYQDKSDDPGVSFKTPAHVPAKSSGVQVMAHEMEHVSRESGKAAREGNVLLSQSIRLFTDICPECKKIYVSGGETTTTTAAKNNKDYFKDMYSSFIQQNFGSVVDVRV